jgi:hypothetical protein
VPDWKPEIDKRLADLKLTLNRETAIIEELAEHLEDHYEELVDSRTTAAGAYRKSS